LATILGILDIHSKVESRISTRNYDLKICPCAKDCMIVQLSDKEENPPSSFMKLMQNQEDVHSIVKEN